MTFTTTPPTTPGLYAWRLKPTHNSSVEKLHIDNTGTLRTREGFEPKSLAGEWCRLVPAEPILEAINFVMPFHNQCYRDKQPAGEPEQPKCRLQGLDTLDYCPHCKIFVVLENAKQVAEGKI